jgi:hypothetical protein
MPFSQAARRRRHDALVGLLDRDRQAVAVEVERVVVLEGPGRLFLLARGGDELADRLDRDAGRDFPRRVPPHSVGYDEQPVGEIDGEGILIVLSLAADVG